MKCRFWSDLKPHTKKKSLPQLITQLTSPINCSREDIVESKNGLLVILTREEVEWVKHSTPQVCLVSFGCDSISLASKCSAKTKTCFSSPFFMQTHLNILLSLAGMTVSEASSTHLPIALWSSRLPNTGSHKCQAEYCLGRILQCKESVAESWQTAWLATNSQKTTGKCPSLQGDKQTMLRAGPTQVEEQLKIETSTLLLVLRETVLNYKTISTLWGGPLFAHIQTQSER